MTTTDTQPVKWNYRKLINLLGGTSGIRSLYQQFGVPPPSQENVLMWIRRDSIPSNRMAMLTYFLEEVKGIPLTEVRDDTGVL